MKEVSSTLCDQYIASRFAVEEDEWPPYKPKHYTTLALIYHRDKLTDSTVISVTKQLATKGNLVPECKLHVNQQESYNTTKSVADLFTAKQTSDGSTFIPNMILIEGAPGIGKTILSKEIAYLWSTNNLLNSKAILFLIFLRNFDSNCTKSVKMLIWDALKGCEIATDIAKYVTRNNGDDIAIVLDGYDEMSEDDRKSSIIADIIHRRVLSKCLLVITSRPTASLQLHNNVDCRVEILGFTEEDRLDYIKSASPEVYDSVKQYLNSNPTINALCYIPLNMTILLCLAKNGSSNLPDTQTEMYKQFIETTIKRFLNRNGYHLIASVTSLSELPSKCLEVFKEMAHFAFEALKHDQLVFTLAELKEMCPNLTKTPSNWNGLGLLKSIKSFDIVTYHFLHFSIQEYMAAYHISTLSDSQQIKLLKRTFWTVRYYNNWIMYVGITGGKSFALKHFLSGNWFQITTKLFQSSISHKLLNNKIKCLHMFQCLAETKDDNMISLVGGLFKDQIIDLSQRTLLPRDLTTLGFFLNRSLNKKWKKLNLSQCNIGNEGCKILCKILLDKNAHCMVRISSIDLSYNQLNYSSFIGLFDLLKSWHTAELIIKDNNIL